jgi:bis(5'-nucleosidyl)-tetraphosphatase
MSHDPTIDSSGIIPCAQKGGEWKIFLVQYRGYEQYWGCPKGHLEQNETHQEAACRELKEETGLDVKRFLRNDPLLEEFYWFKKEERRLKRILFYIAEVEGEVNLQNEEIVDGQWFSLQQAIEKIAHPEGKATLKQVEKVLFDACAAPINNTQQA